MNLIRRYRILLEGYADLKKAALAAGFSEDEIEQTFMQFRKMKADRIIKGPAASIDQYKTLEELKAVIEKAKERPIRPAREAPKVAGTEMIFQDDDWYIFKIQTQEAAIELGRDTNWCIAREIGTAKHPYYSLYADNGCEIFYLVNKLKPNTDPAWKICIVKNQNLDPYIMEVRDKRNTVIKRTWGEVLGLSTSIFGTIENSQPDHFFGNLINRGCLFFAFDERHGRAIAARSRRAYPRGFLSTDNRVDLSNLGLKKLPYSFLVVCADKTLPGGFDCSHNQLETLEGCPEQIMNGDFDCSYNQLKDLRGMPTEVQGKVIVDHNLKDFSEEDVRRAMEGKRLNLQVPEL